MIDKPSGGQPLPDEEPGLGEPVLELAELEIEPQTGFLARIRGRIERRRLASQFLDLSWLSPAVVFLEYLDVIFSALVRWRSRSSKETER